MPWTKDGWREGANGLNLNLLKEPIEYMILGTWLPVEYVVSTLLHLALGKDDIVWQRRGDTMLVGLPPKACISIVTDGVKANSSECSGAGHIGASQE